MNAHFLHAMGCGGFSPLEEVDRGRVREFVTGLDQFATALAAVTGRMDGTPEVLREIEQRLRCVSPSLSPSPGDARSPG